MALPVFSVPTKEDAEELILAVGVTQYEEHPQMPGRPWRKINIGFKQYLELDDIVHVTAKLKEVWQGIEQRRREHYAEGDD